ncbi:MAG: mechanosensitive ion channel family protein, partial [Candidatus Eremiobacteraeota bacterium]|nr:mechanosensitive ion channel family protein [Candidatus Eremiobacteraeota bacterium]
SIEKARATILRVVSSAEGVLDDPGPWAYVEELAGSSVNFGVYFWTDAQQANVLRVRNRVATAIKEGLDAEKIDMPFPHTVVLFHDQTGNDSGDAAGDRPRKALAQNGAQNGAQDGTQDGPHPESVAAVPTAAAPSNGGNRGG